MIEIDEPPDIAACASCGPLTWLLSGKYLRWVAFIPAPDGGRYAIRPHECRFAQDYPTWRQVRRPARPTVEYVEAKELLKSKTQDRNEGEP